MDNVDAGTRRSSSDAAAAPAAASSAAKAAAAATENKKEEQPAFQKRKVSRSIGCIDVNTAAHERDDCRPLHVSGFWVAQRYWGSESKLSLQPSSCADSNWLLQFEV